MTGEESAESRQEQDESLTRVLLLDDEPINLTLRSVVLRKNGYECFPVSTIEEAHALFPQIDIAVIDYHLGAGQFGSEVALRLRSSRPEVPIIILSATLEHYFGGAEDLHLLKGYSSNENLIAAIRSLDAKRRGAPVVVNASQFFCSRLFHALGNDVLVQIFDQQGLWVDCNEAAAEFLGQPREWFPGRDIDMEMPNGLRSWRQVVLDVLNRGETYIDRSRLGLLPLEHASFDTPSWSVVAAPIQLHDGQPGVLLTARMLSAVSN